jgi:hypothetical protein
MLMRRAEREDIEITYVERAYGDGTMPMLPTVVVEISYIAPEPSLTGLCTNKLVTLLGLFVTASVSELHQVLHSGRWPDVEDIGPPPSTWRLESYPAST